MPKLGSLRSKMLALILIPVVVALAVTTFLAISRASAAQRDAAFSELTQRTHVESLKVDAKVASALQTSRDAAALLAASDGREAATAGMSALLGAHAGEVMAVFAGFVPGGYGKDTPGAKTPGTDKDGSFQPTVALNAKGGVDVTPSPDGAKAALAFVKAPANAVMEPSVYQGTMYVTYQAPITRAGKVVGYAGTANTLADVDKRISKTKLYKHGYAFAVSAKGVLLSSPDKKNNGKESLAGLGAGKHNPALKQVAASIAAGHSGQIETTDPWTGKEVVLTWSKIDASGWSFLTAVPVSEVLAPVNGLRTTLLLVGVLMIVLLSAVILFVANKLTKPIGIVTAAAEKLSDGDVDVKIDVSSNDEVGRLATAFEATIAYLSEKAAAAEAIAGGDLTVTVEPRSERDVLGVAFRHLVDDLRGIVGRVSETASGVSDASRQMAGTSDEAGRAIQEIAVAIGNVAEGTNVQVMKVEGVREAAERAAETARQSAERAHEAAKTAEQAKAMTGDGLVAADEASAAMRGLAESASSVTGAIETLAAKSERIGGIVTTITGLSEQTNLLALNAAIEAARAGIE